MIKHKIKVCFFCPQVLPLFHKQSKIKFGGAEVQVFLISNELSKKKKFDVSIITGDYKLNRMKYTNLNNINILISIPIKSPFSKELISYIKRPLNTLISIIKINPDILIIRGIGFPINITNIIAALFCIIMRKKLIFSIASNRETNGMVEKGILGKIFINILKKSKYVITQNSSQLSNLQERYEIKESRIKTIISGYKIPDSFSTDKEFILWVGRANKIIKRPEFFINLAEDFPKEKFLMICNKESDNHYWRQLLDRINKTKNLEFHEFIPFHEIDAYFEKSKIFINTSEYEGFPNTFIQALKHRTPIISMNVNPNRFIDNNKVGFYCGNSYKNLKQNLKLLLKNGDKYRIFSNNALNYINENHNIKNTIEKWIKIIEKVYFE